MAFVQLHLQERFKGFFKAQITREQILCANHDGSLVDEFYVTETSRASCESANEILLGNDLGPGLVAAKYDSKAAGLLVDRKPRLVVVLGTEGQGPADR